MRFASLALWGIVMIAGASLRAQEPPPPDAAPTIAVESSEMPALQPTREDAVLEAFVDGVVESHRRQHHAPGVVVSVVRDGRMIFAKGYGEADIAAVMAADGERSLFRLGSISKTFVWTAAMMLVDRGQLDLDTDVNVYLKDVEIPSAFDAPVTMRHLMAHRAGFEDSFSVYTYADDSDVSMADALMRDMPKRIFPPGARTSYSNWGTTLAAQVIEDASGVPFKTFVRNEILGPLEMRSTTLEGYVKTAPALQRRFAKGYRIKAQRGVEDAYMQSGPHAPAGAMFSTAADMARWMRFHLGGGELDGVRLMSREAHQTLLSRSFDDRPLLADMGHGFFTEDYRGVRLVGHNGAMSSFYASMVMAPELGVGVFMSQNTTASYNLNRDLAKLVIASVIGDEGASAQAVFADFDEVISDYTGAYSDNRRSFSRFEKFISASTVTTVSADGRSGLVLSGAGGARAYSAIGNGVFEGADGRRIAFHRNERGAVTHMIGPGMTAERIGGLEHPVLLIIGFVLVGVFSVTTWLGAWRRQGRDVQTATIGRMLSVFSLGVAGVYGLFAIAGLVFAAAYAGFMPSQMVSYPTPEVIWFRAGAHVVFGCAVLAVASLVFVWRGAGWSLWRKAHHTAFAISLGFLGVMMLVWNVVFSATA